MLKNFSSHLTWKLSWTPFHKWSPLFQWMSTRLSFPLQKGLPWSTASYEIWFTGATLIEIGVYRFLCALLKAKLNLAHLRFCQTVWYQPSANVSKSYLWRTNRINRTETKIPVLDKVACISDVSSQCNGFCDIQYSHFFFQFALLWEAPRAILNKYPNILAVMVIFLA